jgi:hypothetical protein
VFLVYPIAMVLRAARLGGGREERPVAHSRRRTSCSSRSLVGTTITPYMQLYQAAAVADRGIGPDEYRRGADRRDLRRCSPASSSCRSSSRRGAIGGSGPLTSASRRRRPEPVAGAGGDALRHRLARSSCLAAAVVRCSTPTGSRRRSARNGRSPGACGGAALPGLFTAGHHRRGVAPSR